MEPELRSIFNYSCVSENLCQCVLSLQFTNMNVRFCFKAYYTLIRSKSDTVDAIKDASLLKFIINLPSEDELSSFRSSFVANFSSPYYQYELNKDDSRTELKAFMILVSLMLLNVEDISGMEETEILPLLQICWKDPYFDGSHQALGAIFFGFAGSKVSIDMDGLVSFRCTNKQQYYVQVVQDLAVSVRMTRVKVAFKDDVLRFLISSNDLPGCRCLHYLSIAIFYDLAAFAFLKNFDHIQLFVDKMAGYCAKQNGGFPIKLTEDLCHFESEIFTKLDDMVLSSDMERQLLQRKTGYTLLIKYLVTACQQNFHLVKVRQPVAKKRGRSFSHVKDTAVSPIVYQAPEFSDVDDAPNDAPANDAPLKARAFATADSSKISDDATELSKQVSFQLQRILIYVVCVVPSLTICYIICFLSGFKASSV